MREFLFLNVLLAVNLSQAYLDPGSGSLFFQGIIVTLIGGFYFVKNKVLALRKKKQESKSQYLEQPLEKPAEASNAHGN